MTACPLSFALLVALHAIAAQQTAAPPTLLAGDFRSCSFAAGAVDLRLPLEIERVEPLSIHVASYDADVDLALEDSAGARVASDRDSALETNAFVRWTPQQPGRYVLRVSSAESGGGTAAVQVLRGAPAVDAREPAFAARAYWEIARQQALRRSDEARASAALEHLRALASGEAWDEAAFLRREQQFAELDSLASEAESLVKARDVRAAREKALAASDALRAMPDGGACGSGAALLDRVAAVATDCAPLPVRIELSERGLFLSERHVSEADPDLPQRWRLRLVRALTDAGELGRARAEAEHALKVRRAALAEGHRLVSWASNELGRAAAMQRDFQVARSMFEFVVSHAAELEASDAGLIAAARNNLAAALAESGDLEAARALEEELLAALRARFAPDHPSVLQMAANHATTLRRLGEIERAVELHCEVIAATVAKLDPSDPGLLLDRGNLASELYLVGRVDEARALIAEVLAIEEAAVPADDPNLLRNRATFAVFEAAAGNDAEAARILGEVVDALGERVPGDDGMLAWARRSLCLLQARRGETELALAALEPLMSAVDDQLARAAMLSVHEAQVAAAHAEPDVGAMLALHRVAPASVRARIFETVETRRIVANGARSSRRAADDDVEIAALRSSSVRARERASQYVAAWTGAGRARPPFEQVSAAVRARDAADAELERALAERGRSLVRADAARLAAALAPGEVAIGFVESKHPEISVSDGPQRGRALCAAFVIRPGAAAELVELGERDAIAQAAARWRNAIGRELPDEGGRFARGIGGTAPAAPRSGAVDAGAPRTDAHEALRAELAASRALRALVFDPLAARAGDARTWFVCTDGPLHGVALDALAFDAEAGGEPVLVGDRLRIVDEISFERWFAPAPPPNGSADLVAVGGIDYSASGAAASHSGEFATPALASLRDAPALYRELPGTAGEVRSLAKLFEAAFERPARVLDGARATKAALASASGAARLLHVATHGYFASSLPAAAGGALVEGVAPMSLCGLALAGAGRGVDEVGRAPGILTAEELASFDLSQCDLAVLSACDTNAGVGAPGAGLHSLRAALHAGGARSTITCLWRVDDRATAELMRELYARLFAERASRADALWAAKCALRARGAPTRDWAGWRLSGDPAPLAAIVSSGAEQGR